MSFITLKSEESNNYVSNSESAATFTNYFESPIELGTGNTLQLVSCSIKREAGQLLILEGVNDTLIWRLGVGAQSLGGVTPFFQHTAVMRPATYTGDELAVEIAIQLNRSTTLGMFKGEWTCVYTEEPGAGEESTDFTIGWDQKVLPTPNLTEPIQGIIFSRVEDSEALVPIVGSVTQVETFFPLGFNTAGSRMQFINVGNINTGKLLRQLNTDFIILAQFQVGFPWNPAITTDLAFDRPSLGQLGDKSIFANGGSVSGIMRPVAKVSDYNFEREISPGVNVNTVEITNYNNVIGLVEVATMTPLVGDLNGWTYGMTVPNDKLGSIETSQLRAGLNGLLEVSPVAVGGINFQVDDICILQTTPEPTLDETTLATIQVQSVTATGEILNFILLRAGSGYLGQTNVIAKNINLNGTDATIAVQELQTSEFAIGKYYTALDVLDVLDPEDAEGGTSPGLGATVEVLTTSASGGILTFRVIERGETYSVGDTILVTGAVTSPAGFRVSNAELVITQTSLGFGNKNAVVQSDGTLGIGSGGNDAVEANFDYATFLMEIPASEVLYNDIAILKQTTETTGQTFIGPGNPVPENTLMTIENKDVVTPPGGGDVTAQFFRPGTGYIVDADPVVATGIGYNLNETGTLLQQDPTKTGSGATYQITAVNGTGGVLSYILLDTGVDYEAFATYDLIPDSGALPSAASFLVTAVSSLTGSRGAGYSANGNAQPTGNVAGKGTGTGLLMNWSTVSAEGQITGGLTRQASGTGYVAGDQSYILGGGPAERTGMAIVQISAATPITPGGGGGAVTDMTIIFEATYPATQVAYVRNDLVAFGSASNGVPASQDINKRYSYREGEADVQVNLKSTPENTLSLSISQMEEVEGKRFPEEGWRTFYEVLNVADISVLFAQAGAGGYIYGKSTVKAEIVVSAITELTVNLYHNSNGRDDEAFSIPVLVAASGILGGQLKYRPQEAHYPLTPFVSTATSLPFYPGAESPQFETLIPYTALNGGLSELIIGGVYDTDEAENFFPGQGRVNAVPGNILADALPLPAAGAQSLPLLVKSSALNSEDYFTPPEVGTVRQVSLFDKEPNDVANIGRTLSYFPAYNIAPAINGSVSSNPNKAPDILANQGTIQVELPDFNIKSYSGQSGDRGRAIGVIPTEEFATNTNTGTLHFQANYPRPIDLNLPFLKPFYSIECRLRNLDGTVVTNLKNSTEVVLLVGESEESKQQKVMTKSMETLGGLMANQQDQKISSSNYAAPLI